MDNYGYTRKVINRSGRVVFLPVVGSSGDLLTDANIDPLVQTKAQEFPLGAKLVEGERVYRYCRNGAGTPAIRDALQGAVAQNAAAHLDIVVKADVAIAAHVITLTSQADIAVAANYFKEAYLFVNEGTGLGQCCKIKANTE